MNEDAGCKTIQDIRRLSITRVVAIASVLLMDSSCSSFQKHHAGEAQFNSLNAPAYERAGIARPTRAELQDEVLRFETRFSARMNDAFRPFMQSPSNTMRRQSLRSKLYYTSAAFDIALGAIPEQNLLDMIIFVQLIRDIFRDYWIPNVFKQEGKPILEALDQSSEDLAGIARVYLTQSEIAELRMLVDQWHQDNPGVVAVETVRLSNFSTEAGAREKQLASKISGIFSPVIGATIVADKALQLGERGLHYALRAPWFLRMQTAVGLQDSLRELETSLPFDQSKEVLAGTQNFVHELHPIIVEFRKITDMMARNPHLIEGSGTVLKNLSGVLNEYGKLLAQAGPNPNANQLVGLIDRIRADVERLIFDVLLVGILFLAFAGITYVTAKLTYERFSIKRGASTGNSKEGKKAA